MLIYPARTIESDVVLIARQGTRVIDHDIKYEDSDHHRLKEGSHHVRLYPHRGESDLVSW